MRAMRFNQLRLHRLAAALVASLALASLPLLPGPAAAAAPMISCLIKGGESAPELRGPCTAADSVAVLPPVGAFAPVFMTNFGLLFEEAAAASDGGAGDGGAGRKKYGLICEESFGGKVPERFVRHPDGRLLLATFDGVYGGAQDGCGFTQASGSTAFRSVPAVVVDPADPRRVLALTRTPPLLHESLDGGRTFAVKTELPPDLRPERLYAVATAPGTTIYLGAYTTAEPLVLGLSDDGGATFRWQRFGKDAFGRPDVSVQLDGPDPAVPANVYVASGVPTGADEIWRSTDGGQHFARVLALAGTEVRAGLAFGPPGAVHVAGRELFPSRTGPSAHLYVSRDGGATFGPGQASPPEGPTYRCLEAAGGRLYACGGGPGDQFLFGFSDDEGASWTPAATITDIGPPRACTSGRCLATATWLCDAYGICSDDLPKRDAQPADVVDVDAGTSPKPDGQADDGCGCRLGGPMQPSRNMTLELVAALVAAACVSVRSVRRQRRRSR
jgi:hypothetical protein